MNKKTNLVMIAKPECLKCKHLFASNKKAYLCIKAKLCPAKHYQIILGLDIELVSSRLATAFKENDHHLISELTKSLDGYDQHLVNEIMNRAKLNSN